MREGYHPVLAFKSRADARPAARTAGVALERCARGGRGIAGNPAHKLSLEPIVNEHTHNDRNLSPDESSEQHETIALSENLEKFRGTLREAGVARVVAVYKDDRIVAAFLNCRGTRMVPPGVDAVLSELARLLGLVVKRRTPAGVPKSAVSGTFDWHLSDNTLIHEQTIAGL
jgi:hypothetical protein